MTALRCTACGRALDASTVTIQSAYKMLHYGPVCARRLGLTAPLPANEKRVQRVQVVSMAKRRKRKGSDPAQPELFGAEPC
jgi:hypothetical protein